MAEFTVYGFVNRDLVTVGTESEALANGFSSTLRNLYDADHIAVIRIVDGRRVLHTFEPSPF